MPAIRRQSPLDSFESQLETMPATRIQTGASSRHNYATDSDVRGAHAIDRARATRLDGPGLAPSLRAGATRPYERLGVATVIHQIAQNLRRTDVPRARSMLSQGQRAYTASTINRAAHRPDALRVIAQGGMSGHVASRAAVLAAARIASDRLGPNTSIRLAYDSRLMPAVPRERQARATDVLATDALHASLSVPDEGSINNSQLRSRTRSRRQSNSGTDDDDDLVYNDDNYEHDDEFVVDDEDSDNSDDHFDESVVFEDVSHLAANLGFQYRRGTRALSSAMVGASAFAAVLHAERDHMVRQQPEQPHADDVSALEVAHRHARTQIEHPRADDIKKKFPSMICPITHEVFRDPVVASDGQTYERVSIERWFGNGHRTSPVTNAVLGDLSLRENVLARNLIEEFLSNGV